MRETDIRSIDTKNKILQMRKENKENRKNYPINFRKKFMEENFGKNGFYGRFCRLPGDRRGPQNGEL